MNNSQAQIIVTYVKQTTGKKTTLKTSNDTTESVNNNRSGT